MGQIRYRHPTEADVGSIVRAWNLSRRGIPLERDFTIGELRAEIFDDEDYDINGSWVAEAKGEIVGFGCGTVERRRVESGLLEGFVTVEVVPEHRGRGIEKEIMNRVLAYLRSRRLERAEQFCPTLTGWRNTLSEEYGFRGVRHFFRMVRKGGNPPKDIRIPAGVRFERKMFKDADEGDVSLLVATFNDTFSEHFGFSPVSAKRWLRLRDAYEDVGMITFAVREGRTVGICFSDESVLYNKEHASDVGWVWMIGVTKSERGKGIGRALLADSVAWLAGRGIGTVYLGLDAENRKALILYTSLGFDVIHESVYYRLVL
ncbi:MAG: GNAT family N-acetyltransferase [Thermoplasmatota archaeon]|nr:GNAT family N-acetyltransferase [Candidatus Thermoplasmatota archaeon]MBU1914816.1 GNAT family N-acetyltransferase [Candidatus Thermoplasmatota archaeon]